MPEWFRWFFDGIGTELFSAAIGIIVGGFGGFVIGRRTKGRQIQKAGYAAKQKQSLLFEIDAKDNQRAKNSENILQKQTAGEKAEQFQSGKIKHGQ